MTEIQENTARRLGFDAHGRNVALFVEEQVDKFDQFRVAVVIDGKERWAGHFTCRCEERP